ncbi:Serine/threonine-protein kinase wnk4 [Mortierella polycephala]|uniref:non-specific serine/threonine protein kinase n=1 Tax=Mortierella polycephala TaxID=41804 RepID=A0A9P6PMB3_9FUNG|nr:Serine/threonine-protein kinase wnk4 [Mortierella polycephala]
MGASSPSDQADTDGDAPLETDPTGRFQRLNEVLGEGAYKHVYKAIDQEEGVEVAWNQLRIDHLTKKEAQKILSEIEILQSIRNDHIINFYASWSTKAPNGGERVVFVTELMSSGTLKQYLKKTLKGALKPKVLKSWCRQILQGLVYLHTHDPPIIHRDLKCDNIFVNGNNGQLKIGDLGLAVVRHRTHVSSVLGTPEFMAPELYDEKYDEKVDIYAFGMCVLEMVTKEYPYSECTNQAQIYRKVTLGIKPKSLDHVQDPEVREFINRCLDHDDHTRPSAQELLDSDFLKPCLAIPSHPGSIFFNYPNRSMPEGLEATDSPLSAYVTNSFNRSSFAEQFASSSISPTPINSLPAPSTSVLPRTYPMPNKITPPPISIPAPEFTTTTVDADNKTYHIRSNLMPQTPTSVEQDDDNSAPEETVEQGTDRTSEQQETEASNAEPPTLHSHANEKTCSIQVVQYGESTGDQLNLKMICTCPVAGPRDVNVAAGTHEIKFPFDLKEDTVELVVDEMIREQILSGDDREEAASRIHELIDSVVLARKEHARVAKERARINKAHHASDRTNRSASNAPKNGHHRQLNVPPIDDLDQYGTSPTESMYDHYSSIGSNASIGWNYHDSSIESDQGYGTVPPQQPPVITEATFPPLMSRSKSAETDEHTFDDKHGNQQHLASYSEAVQHPATEHPSLVPCVNNGSPSASRPQSVYSADVKRGSVPSMDMKPALMNGGSGTLRDIETAATLERKKHIDDDVGYTSPYRHGVSSSSISSHRRSPSVDASVFIAPLVPTSASLHVGPSEPSTMSPTKTPGTLVEQEIPSPTLSGGLSTRSVAASTPNGISAATFALLVPGVQSEHQTSHSADVRDHEPQHSHLQTHTTFHRPSLSSVESVVASDTKKDIEPLTNKLPNQDRTNGGSAYANGSNYSSCPEMSDDEDILDEDLKTLRETQRQELELMRLQHVQQWEKMMRLKEQKGQQGIRRKSDVDGIPPAAPSRAPASTPGPAPV